MSAQTTRLRDENIIFEEGVIEFFREAFQDARVLPNGWDPALNDFRRMMKSDHVAVFIGGEDGKLQGLAIVALPINRLTPVPQVYHFYNAGSSELRDLLIEDVVRFVREAGYDKFWATNLSSGSDSAWKKVFQSAGRIEKIGSMMEFSI